MFERFTNQSRRSVVLAQEEARMLNHNYIGTEHLLLGLLHEGQGSAARALNAVDVTLGAVREQVVTIIGRGQEELSGHIPFTPRAKKSLELSLREALQLGDGYIGTGHLLLGLIHEGSGVAVQIIEKLGVDLKDLRALVIRELREQPEEGQTRTGPTTVESERTVRVVTRPEVQGLLDTIAGRLSAIEQHLGITRARAKPETSPTTETAEATEIVEATEIAEAAAGARAGGGESDEIRRLQARVAELEARLREHGIDPDEPLEPPAAGAAG